MEWKWRAVLFVVAWSFFCSLLLFASQVRGEAVCDLCCVAVVSASGSLNFLFGGDLLEFCGVWDVFLGVVRSGVVLRVAIAGGKNDVVRMRCE